MNGILNVYKEQGYTSHDVVARLRGILHQKKIGHTGTLDPNAVGVLPVCLGNATKVCDLLTDADKEYRAQLVLGLTTDTQDITGRILTADRPEVSAEQIRTVIDSFMGSYDQIPPMYSARKIHGQRLYDLARQGKEVEREPRTVHIYEIEAERIEPEGFSLSDSHIKEQLSAQGSSAAARIEGLRLPLVTLRVRCSKGTYIRTLCQDIGERLGTGGCMAALTRTRVGSFEIHRARTISQIEEIWQTGDVSKILMPVDALFEELTGIRVTKEGEKLLKNGNPLPPEVVQDLESYQFFDNTRVRVYDADGCFQAIYQYDRAGGKLVTVKMFL